ncbi:c-type cytochrome [Aliiglaciecola sp. CAU 1673]|uniref:c-type cytochrome n=1 Tax=Aliiglaciecola sp. CAU 1673 TaxID=3032595 RepID=UPI0023DCD2D8|nr:c-type cytochrome [Aliiglaciecola sp. CAU 1673]MDF2176893.1 c-type cytochrome [Aliiglaciecola sp. CAU 1673]
MKRLNELLILFLTGLTFTLPLLAKPVYEKDNPPRKLTAVQAERAQANYKKYCVLCHGENREGHKNDHAPSLRSLSLMESGIPHGVLRPLSYGRAGTAMGGYLDEVGGPMTLDEIWDLTYWLYWQSGAQRVKLSENPVPGDIAKGEEIYKKECASCHGANGEGTSAPALANPSFLAHSKDEFIRYAIVNGRDGTPMPAFYEKLLMEDINNVTAYLRSKEKDWQDDKPLLQALPEPKDYVINPQNSGPDFNLRDGIYVSSADLHKAVQAKKRMMLIDTRVPSVWQRAHIEGAVPFPYYTDIDKAVKDLPKDVQIVAYCSCPRAAADHVVYQLRARGFKNTAVLYEGIFGWMNLGYPVARAEGISDTSATSASH